MNATKSEDTAQDEIKNGRTMGSIDELMSDVSGRAIPRSGSLSDQELTTTRQRRSAGWMGRGKN